MSGDLIIPFLMMDSIVASPIITHVSFMLIKQCIIIMVDF
jgi:hypothetical protein